ncbi:hypothetical protein PV08_07032 [Exophiala spinifera]|uniref:Uncharacterized protein n=1 Tax=Exophiala spinifera TaxID=91928 RepID=A0A0D2B6D2_9EURO|nr:uncharacterized protein PV08_07032 [Exophiala spinifera]KIW14250.1 hypothetical protein PV08_07032 [Exophiala spinifera]
MLARRTLWFYIFGPASSAYLQANPCKTSSFPTAPVSLDARLEHLPERTSELSLTIDWLSETDQCLQLLGNAPRVNVDIQIFASSFRESTTFNITCHQLDRYPYQSLLRAYTSTDLGALYPLSWIHADVHLQNNSSEELQCLTAQITPGLNRLESGLLRYVPIAGFALVLGSAVFFLGTTLARKDGQRGGQRDRACQVLPTLVEFFMYVQFVFLTASLSLRYPGFYQPAISRLNWFSLFSNSALISHGHVYPSTRDGIYEVNGTYGGTFGLELMA